VAGLFRGGQVGEVGGVEVWRHYVFSIFVGGGGCFFDVMLRCCDKYTPFFFFFE